MQIQADRFLALTAMLAGFVPNGPEPQGGAPAQQVEAVPAVQRPDEVREARPGRSHGDDVRRGG